MSCKKYVNSFERNWNESFQFESENKYFYFEKKIKVKLAYKYFKLYK
jgi:hypothetical protein